MAKEREITRTLSVTVAKILCIDLTTEKLDETEVKVSGVYKDKKDLVKAITKVVNTDTYKLVSIKDTKVIEKQYALSEQTFMKLAREVEKEDKQ